MSIANILIADDDHDLVNSLAIRCEQLGLTVDSAHNAMQAIRMIDERIPDLVILDVNMPAGDGLGVCELMSRHEQLSMIPVIVLTGDQDEETIRRCHSLCAYYVQKCPMVWLRIEPLLKDLLDLPEVKPESPRETDSLAKQIKSACDRSIDQVFTLFGWDEEFLAQENAPETIDRPTDERQWVLCIDDDPDVTLSLKLRLQQHGVEAVRAFAGMEGYRTAFLSPPAAITLDYEMPDGQGDYVLGRLKENPVTKDIPVIVLTGRKEKSLERKMLALGAADFLTKPYDWNQLWDTLAPHLAAPTVVNAI